MYILVSACFQISRNIFVFLQVKFHSDWNDETVGQEEFTEKQQAAVGGIMTGNGVKNDQSTYSGQD